MRVLLIAENANPEWTSVPLEGWSHARALCELVDGHLVTQVRNREAIERAGWREGEQFTAIDTEAVAGRLHRAAGFLRGGKGTGWTISTAASAIGNYYFERCVWKRFQADLRAGRFDLVHRLIPLTPTAPSPIAGKLKRIGVPFVMGPLNGGLPWPRQFDAARRKEREWLSYVRGLHKLLPGYHATRRNAAAIIVGSRATFDQMPARYHPKCVYIPENAIDPDRFTVTPTRRATPPIRVVFVGRLVPYKGPDMLLDAAAPLLQAGKVTLSILGDGPLMPDLQRRVADQHLPGVELPGWIPHEQLQHRLAEADVFAFPSIREFGGAVVLEAMVMGCIPVVVDYGGPGELVTDDTGIKIPLASREQIVEHMRAALTDLADHPDRIEARRPAARQRVLDHFTWPAKARQVCEVYQAVLAKRSVPRFIQSGKPVTPAPMSHATAR